MKLKPHGQTGKYYTQSVSVSGGTIPYTFTVTDGDIPDGLQLRTYSYLGEIYLSGTPTKAGTYNFTIKIEDSKGKTIEQKFTVTIDPSTSNQDPATSDLKIDGTFENGMTGMYYGVNISVSGGTRPYTYTVTKGNLPDGLELRAYSYLGQFGLGGTPTKAGTYTFTIKIEDSTGKTIEQKFTVTINSATPNPDPTPNPTPVSKSGGGGGGCDSGMSGLCLAVLGAFTLTRRK